MGFSSQNDNLLGEALCLRPVEIAVDLRLCF